MRTTSNLLSLVFAVAFVHGCGDEELSPAARRCAHTTCNGNPVPGSEYQTSSRATDERPEGRAIVVWHVERPDCGDGQCTLVSAQGASINLARWAMHADGSISVVDTYVGSGALGALSTSAGVLVRRYAPDGTRVWEHDLGPDVLGMLAPSIGLCAVTVAADDSLVIALGGKAQLIVQRLIADDPSDIRVEELFRDHGGTLPDAMVWADHDLLIAGYASGTDFERRNAEVSRYRVDGTLVWRQSELHWNGSNDRTPMVAFGSGIRIASDVAGRSTILSAHGEAYAGAQLDEAGILARSLSGGPDTGRFNEIVRGQVRIERGRLIFGGDDSDIYAVHACDDPPACDSFTEVFRHRISYYSPALHGLAVDGASRVLVLTQDGTRGTRMMLVDRYAKDMLSRQTFVVSPTAAVRNPGATLPEYIFDMTVGPDGDLYYIGESALGRIHLNEGDAAPL